MWYEYRHAERGVLVTRMAHTSAPASGADFPPELLAALRSVARVLIPGDDHYPAADEAGVARFIAARAGPGQISLLRRLTAGLPVRDPDRLAGALSALERREPAGFGQLRDAVYQAYYCSPRVLAALADRGYDYHGAPQPLGYPLGPAPAAPTHARGSYLATSEVRHVEV